MAIAAQIPNAAQSTFTSIILETFGFSALETQYYGMPGTFSVFRSFEVLLTSVRKWDTDRQSSAFGIHQFALAEYALHHDDRRQSYLRCCRWCPRRPIAGPSMGTLGRSMAMLLPECRICHVAHNGLKQCCWLYEEAGEVDKSELNVPMLTMSV
jgi:hypothetical protein